MADAARKLADPTPARTPGRGRVYDSITETIGDTPLVRLNRLPKERGVEADILAKLEFFNPIASVKDRIGVSMIDALEAAGAIRPGGTLVEPTSGNTGIALAFVAAARGYRLILTMPETMSQERRKMLALLGAELVLTPGEQQMEGAVAKARQIARETPRAFSPSQFDNPENPRCHRETTAREILHVMRDRSIDAFVAGVGTGGTISGVGAALRRERREARIIAVEPASSASLSGGERGPTKIQGLAAGFVPKNFDREVVHEIRLVSDRDAYDTKIALARNEGLLVGISAGAAVHAALQVARELGPGKNVVTLLPDTGERYFSLDEYFV